MANEIKIGDRLFRVDAPLATEALRLQFRVMNLVSGSAEQLPKAIAALTTAKDGDASAKAQANAQMVGVVMSLLGGMKPEEGTRLIADLVGMAKVQGANGRFEVAELDTEFSSDPAGLYELVGFVLKVTLGPFISGLVGSMSGGRTPRL